MLVEHRDKIVPMGEACDVLEVSCATLYRSRRTAFHRTAAGASVCSESASSRSRLAAEHPQYILFSRVRRPAGDGGLRRAARVRHLPRVDSHDVPRARRRGGDKRAQKPAKS